MSKDSVIHIEQDGSIATVIINRPDKLNALDRDVLIALRAAIEELTTADGVRCVILAGEGKAFVAGADIAAMKNMSPEAAAEFSRLGHNTFDMLESLPKPVIAAVNGFALGGGCELALACDFIVASSKAKFGQPEVKLGVTPGFGGTQRLARRVGLAMARELIYTGDIIDAEEGRRIGLVNRVVAPEELMAVARERAALIAQAGPHAVSACKHVLLAGADHPLPEANAREVDAFASCFATDEQREGMAAFLEKRPAQFD